MSYQQLLARARDVAAALGSLGMRKGDRVGLALPSEEDFVTAYLGVLTGGGVAVPLAPPLGIGKLSSFLDATTRMLTTAGAGLLITSKSIRAIAGTLRDSVPTLTSIVTCAELVSDTESFAPPEVTLQDLAMLQFTSGSTSHPKGVMLTHGNLAANCWVIVRQGLEAALPDRCVSWLPLFHDMGTIGFVLCPMYSEIPLTLIPPTLFATRPAVWLKVLSAHKGTITYAPNFAYAYASKRIRDSDLVGVDLSHVRVMGCGAEPINAETLRTFAQRFGKVGFRAEAFFPSYGMAESSVAISFGRGIRTDRVDALELEANRRAIPAHSHESRPYRELVACGGPFLAHEIRIVDPDSDQVLGERVVGEIRVAGPSVTAGYFRATDATRAVFDDAGFLRTGDLGYFANSQLFVCGRIKDLIIVRGRNCAPQDLEWEVGKIDGVRPGGVAAFSVPSSAGDTESVVVVAEVKRDADPDPIVQQIRTRILDELGINVASVELVDPGTLPKTTSGKLRRSEVRSRFLAGDLQKRPTDSVSTALKQLMASQWGHLKSALPFSSPPARD